MTRARAFAIGGCRPFPDMTSLPKGTVRIFYLLESPRCEVEPLTTRRSHSHDLSTRQRIGLYRTINGCHQGSSNVATVASVTRDGLHIGDSSLDARLANLNQTVQRTIKVHDHVHYAGKDSRECGNTPAAHLPG